MVRPTPHQRITIGLICCGLMTGLTGVTAPVAEAATKPSITKVAPARGYTTGGTTITVTGKRFTKVKKVIIGGVKAKKVTVISATKLKVVTPAHRAGRVAIAVTTAKGTTTRLNAFTYLQPPLRASGPITATSNRTISGLKISNPAGPCITVPAGVHDVTITGNQIGPCGKNVDGLGITIKERATRIVMTSNVIHDVSSGVHAYGSFNPITFSGNTVYNVRGPYPRGQMIQFDSVSGSAGQSKITGNVSDKQAATIATKYEDHINMYKSSGSVNFPTLIACNKIRGGGPSDHSDTGSGIMVGDNGGGWYLIDRNVIVLTPNTGIGIAGGHDITATRNQIYNRGTTKGSKTQEALTVFSYAGFTPTTITLRDNRGASHAWLTANGPLVNGYWDSGDILGLTSSNNSWTDTTLTASIFAAPTICS